MSDDLANDKMPNSGKFSKSSRAILNTASGTIPVVGGALAALSACWSENEQDKVNSFFDNWLQMIQDEIKEKEQTIFEIISRIDLQDEKIAQRISSQEYQSLLKKTFREWSGAENAEKRIYIRNILSNAAASEISSDDVIRLYIDWINKYSDLHFVVIKEVYKSTDGITRGNIWSNIGKPQVSEDSADADLYRLLFRDLSTGGIIRQFRQTNYAGDFIKKQPKKQIHSSNTMKSAFDQDELYVLTKLGKQFIHYAMTDLPLKIKFSMDETSKP